MPRKPKTPSKDPSKEPRIYHRIHRIRSIKPEFWTDEKLAALDPVTRLTYIGLWTLADDEGRLIDNVKSIDGTLFSKTNDSSRDSLEMLARMGRVVRYRSSNGQPLVQIVRWLGHQRIDKPTPSKHEPPSDALIDAALAQVERHQQLMDFRGAEPTLSLAFSGDSRDNLRQMTDILATGGGGGEGEGERKERSSLDSLREIPANGTTSGIAHENAPARRTDDRVEALTDDCCVEWENVMGGLPSRGRILTAVRELVRAGKHADALVPAWRRYLTHCVSTNSHLFASPATFARTYGRWTAGPAGTMLPPAWADGKEPLCRQCNAEAGVKGRRVAVLHEETCAEFDPAVERAALMSVDDLTEMLEEVVPRGTDATGEES